MHWTGSGSVSKRCTSESTGKNREGFVLRGRGQEQVWRRLCCNRKAVGTDTRGVLTGAWKNDEGSVTNWKDGYRNLKNVVKYFYCFEDYCTSIS